MGAVMAVANSKEGLQPLSQAAMFSHGGVFEERIAGLFAGGKRAILSEHHGMYCVGRTAAEAFFVAFHLIQACEVQMRSKGMGAVLNLPGEPFLTEQYRDFMSSPDYGYDGRREWPGAVRKLN